MTFKKKIWILVLHFFLGILLISFPPLIDVSVILLLIVGINKIILTRNSTGLAHKLALYIVGAEILIRNYAVSSIPYEFGKYAVVGLLLIGRSVEQTKTRAPSALFIYFLCLLPSIFLTDMGNIDDNRKEVLFNLSGPLSLYVAGLYFYNRKFTVEELKDLVYWGLCSLVVIIAIIYYRMPTLNNVTFALGANSKTSGGFGPNQVSTILGSGMVLLSLSYLFNFKITGKRVIDTGLLAVFTALGFLTFSRGGVISAFLAIILGYVVSLLNNREARKAKSLVFMIVFALLMVGVWNYVGDLTGDTLEKRYRGETAETESKGRYSVFTGRDKIAKIDIAIFFDNVMMGVGPGMSTFLRMDYGYHDNAAAHTELTRLLAEHGLFGVASLIILLVIPIRKYWQTGHIKRVNKIIIIIFFTLSISTMVHSAMRTAMVGFFYGLAFIDLSQGKKPEDEEQEEAKEEKTEAEEEPGIKMLLPA
jgi:hypothetical protein